MFCFALLLVFIEYENNITLPVFFGFSLVILGITLPVFFLDFRLLSWANVSVFWGRTKRHQDE